ncbi:BREX-1 system adenine-specific DNA-methyltransferase PglX, partial [uncultured Desulfovibrio sp.]|uniref:BREX-1 system adenine-specific DNA-methyltransferase PglX n=1 Tax=uncultured Desulfovibrio sp. TaxID=167968 RepID=UPI00272D92B7
ACMEQFKEADNFGSLIRPVVKNAAQLREILAKCDVGGNLLVQPIHERVLKILKMAEYLSPRYHVVIANPPYMGGRGMNARLAAWAKENYPDSKSDLFAMFMERGLELVMKRGYCAMVTMQSWMFLSSFENLRAKLFKNNAISSMAHLGARAFDSIGGEVVSTTAFVISKSGNAEFKGEFLRLTDGKTEEEKAAALQEAIKNPSCGWFFRASAVDFKKIPGSPIVYWVSEKIREIFAELPKIMDICPGSFGMSPADQSIVLNWYEPSFESILFDAKDSRQFTKITPFAPYDKGGDFRKWFGNQNFVINWRDDGEVVRNNRKAAVRNSLMFCMPHISWTLITSGFFSCRRFMNGFLLDTASNAIYDNDEINPNFILALLNSSFMRYISQILNPTLNFSCGVIGKVPVCTIYKNKLLPIDNCINISKTDWNSYETSWDFATLPLFSPNFRKDTLEATYSALRDHWRQMTLEMQGLEEENNRVFIEAYGLEDELAPDVPLAEITLTCNPHYRYGGNRTEEDMEALLLADTMREFISYAVGCMFGRYALERPGLILASQGQTLDDYNDLVPDA